MELWVPVAVAIAGGATIPKLIDVISAAWTGAAKSRRADLDRMARQLRTSQRREQALLVWARRLELLAVSLGATPEQMPKLDYWDEGGGENIG